jgi:hypothetical protein
MKNYWEKVKLVKAYKNFLSTEDGKLILKDLVRECGMFQNAYRGNRDEMLLREGKRNVLLYILSIINVDLSELIKMVERQSQGEKDE